MVEFLKNAVLALAVFSGIPVFAAMLLTQLGMVFVTIIILTKINAPIEAIKYVSILAFYAMGYAVVATPGGIFFLVIEHLIGLAGFAINRGYALTSPKVRLSAGDGKRNVTLDIAQPWIGPGDRAPQIGNMSDAAHKVAMSQLGMNERGELLE